MLTTSDTGNFSCDSEPVLSGNGKYILCGGHVVPAGLKAAAEYGFTDVTGGAFPKGPVTQGFAEFSATTGKLITILGAWRAPLPHIGPSVIAGAKLPCVLWASPDASTVIGTANGQGIVIHGGRAQQIPWSSRITPPPASSFVPGAAW
jgi:hypothetical protein